VAIEKLALAGSTEVAEISSVIPALNFQPAH